VSGRTSTSGSCRIETAGEAWTIIHAAATDHANRLMRKAGRTAWDAADADAYRNDLYRLLTGWGFWDAERERPTSLYLAMMTDPSAPFVDPLPESPAQ
jgi:hypothetical protein